MDSDMALAEMELLEQNQKRLANLTGRMTTILNGFDRRLVKLESSILPIHRSTQQLSHISSNIESTQQELSRSLQHYGVVVDEEPLILRGPNPRDPWPYLEAIQRVAQGIIQTKAGELKNPEQVVSKMETLRDLGAGNVAELVREYTSTESRPIDLRAYLDQQHGLPTLSSECLTSIKALLQFLSTLEHGARRAESPFHLALASYAQVRSAYCSACLAPLVEQITGVANVVQDPSVHAPREALVEYKRGSAGFYNWLQGMLGMLQNERAIAAALFEGMSWQNVETHTFTSVVQPLVTSVSALLPTLLPRLQHGLNAHRFFVLDFLGAGSAVLGPDGQRWSSALKSTQLPLDLPTAMVQTRQDAVQFFPEVLRDIKVIPVQREHDVLHVDVSDIARLGVQLLRGMAEYQDVLLGLLQTLPAKNWSDSESAARTTQSTGADGLYSDYIFDVLASIVSSLERSVAAVPQATVAAIFLLNNTSYLQQEVSQMHGILPPAAAASIDQLLKQALRSARTSYLESWNNVVNSLVDDGPSLSRAGTIGKLGVLSNNERNRDTTARFFEQISEKERIHRTQPLLRSNRALLESLRDDVVRVDGAPVAHATSHGHQRHGHHTHGGQVVSENAAVMTRSKHASKSKSAPGVMSPQNKLFPLMIVVIVLACLIGTASLALLARCLLRRKPGQDEPEEAMPEKREATLRHAQSYESNATLFDPDFSEKPKVPLARPVMSSVSRGTHGRFGSMSSMALFDPDYRVAPGVPDKCEHTAELREKVMQSRASNYSTDSGSTVYSMHAQVTPEEAASVRQNDLGEPCLTRGAQGWNIHAEHEMDGIEDVSLDGPPRPVRA